MKEVFVPAKVDKFTLLFKKNTKKFVFEEKIKIEFDSLLHSAKYCKNATRIFFEISPKFLLSIGATKKMESPKDKKQRFFF